MAFENGFDPQCHFEPIVNCFEQNPHLTQGIIAFWEEEINNSAWPQSVASSYERLKKLFMDNWAYNCFIQFMVYETEVRNGTRERAEIEKKGLVLDSSYESFFCVIRDNYIPKIVKAMSKT